MDDDAQALLLALTPGGLSPEVLGLLVAASLLTSMITASLGAGGGVLMLVIMSLWLPPLAIIPVHGMVQLGSNGGRALMAWRHIHWPTIGWFLPGVIAGSLLGAVLLVRLPEAVWQLAIALFVLYLCWGPPLPKTAVGARGLVIVGTLTTFVGFFVGATGPLVAAFIKQIHSQRFVTVTTFAMAMVLQHLPKAFVFGLSGFVFQDWLGLILAMIASGAAGTWLGLRVLGRLSDRRFETLFNILLTVLALRLLWEGGRHLL